MSNTSIQLAEAPFSHQLESSLYVCRDVSAPEEWTGVGRTLCRQYVGGIDVSRTYRYTWVNLLDRADPESAQAVLDITETQIEPLQSIASNFETVEEATFYEAARERTAEAAAKANFTDLGGIAVFATNDGPSARLLLPHLLVRGVRSKAQSIIVEAQHKVSSGRLVSSEDALLADCLAEMGKEELEEMIHVVAAMIVARRLPSAARVRADLHLDDRAECQDEDETSDRDTSDVAKLSGLIAA